MKKIIRLLLLGVCIIAIVILCMKKDYNEDIMNKVNLALECDISKYVRECYYEDMSSDDLMQTVRYKVDCFDKKKIKKIVFNNMTGYDPPYASLEMEPINSIGGGHEVIVDENGEAFAVSIGIYEDMKGKMYLLVGVMPY